MITRILLATLLLTPALPRAATWSGGGDGASWDDPGNWVGGSPPGADDPVWEIGEGSTVNLEGAAPGGWIIKRGGGELRVGSDLGATASVEVEGGKLAWTGPLAIGHLGLAGGIATGGPLAVDLLTVSAGEFNDLDQLGDLTAGVLRVEGGGATRWSGRGTVGAVEVTGGTLDMDVGWTTAPLLMTGGRINGGFLHGPATLTGGVFNSYVTRNLTLAGGEIELLAATASGGLSLEGGTIRGNLAVAGSINLANWSGETELAASVYLDPLVTLNWMMELPESVPSLRVTGELVSPWGVGIGFGLVDWSLPFWDETREFVLVDAWEGGVVSASFTIDGSGSEGQGLWSQLESADGDLVVRWTPTDVAAVPEPGMMGLAWASAALAAARWRRKVAGRKGRKKRTG